MSCRGLFMLRVTAVFCLLPVLHRNVLGVCTPGKQLPDAARRSLSYQSSTSLISDATLASGWYTALVNSFYYALANTKPQLAHCGTYNPIYLKDPLPKLAEDKEVELVACLLDYDDDCKLTYKVKVKLCHGIPQYYLVPTDGQSAYCFEPTNIKGIAAAPKETIRGTIAVTVALFYINHTFAYEPMLDFKCNFAEVTGKPTYFYEVTWFINERAEKTSARVHFREIDSTNLNETNILALNYSLGISIKCGVRISSTRSGNQTRIQVSNSFYAGLQVDNPVLTVRRGSSASITAKPTVPLGCARPHILPNSVPEPCDLSIEMFDPSSNYQCDDTQVAILTDQKLCGSTFSGWKRGSNNRCLEYHSLNYCQFSGIKYRLPQVRITVKTTNDLTYRKDETFSLQLRTGANTNHKFWKERYVDRIQVNVRDNGIWQGKICSAYVDPQMQSFDRQRWTMPDRGDFVLYRHKIFKTQVQIKTFSCARYGTCICATAIEAGGDIFLVDICSIKNINFISCKGSVLNVRMINSNNYKVYFPTGTYVDVHIRSSASDFLKVYIYSSPSDVNNTEGMCGNFNGDSRDDSKSSIRATDSLFHNLDHISSSTWEYNQTVCICPKLKDSSLPHANPLGSSEAICTKKEYATCKETVKLQGQQKTCHIRSKRSVQRHQENIKRRMQFTIDITTQKKKREVHEDVPDGVSFKDAYSLCLNVFESKQLFGLKHQVPDQSLNASLEACARDAMIDSTNDDWLQAHFEGWANSITNELRRNTTFKKESPAVVQDFEASVCPSQCNFKGDCVNGTCVCQEDYVGDSCFVRRSTPLNITDIEGNGMCDLSYGDDCHECLQFHTENLLKDFMCRIISHETHEDGSVANSTETVKDGEYENIYEGYCCPAAMDNHVKRRSVGSNPFVTQYQISISNDGRNFGSPRSVYVYDSMCQEYVVMPNGEWLFSLKDDTCFIAGRCVRYGERFSGSECLLCNPIENKFTWTDGCLLPPPTRKQSTTIRPENRKGESEPSSAMIYAISLSLTSVIVIGVIAILVICKFHSKKKRNVESSQVNIKNQSIHAGPAKLQFRMQEKKDPFMIY